MIRTGAAAAALLLAACGAAGGGPAVAEAGNLIECAVAGSGSFARDCAVERHLEQGTLMLVVRHPDGGFRRFEVLADGRGLAAADGAEPAQVSLAGESLAVSIGADRYRFPATIASDAAD